MGKRRRSKKRAVEKMDDVTTQPSVAESRLQIFHPGSCIPGKCKGETACKSFPNSTYTCVCTHDSLPPTLSGECPRRIVNELPGRIPNVQPPSIIKQIMVSNTNHTQTLPVKNQSLAVTESTPYLANFAVPAVALILGSVLFVVVVFYVKMKAKRRHEAASPINLKHSLLIPDRYAPNPQYSACCSTDVPVIRKETLKFLNELGEGCFGKVFKGELLRAPDQKPEVVAIKVLKESASKEAEEDFFREVEIMSAFQHPNILSFIGVVLREGTSCGTISPMMVFEYMEHGDLAEVLRAQRRLSPSTSLDNQSDRSLPPLLEPDDILSIALQIACGMEYLAAQRFVHRDLACRNCLVADGPTVKIADFGMSRDVYTCDYYKIGGSRLLPVRWMSPESVVYGRFTLESDIWSYGVILWEIYSFGKQPYYGHSNEEVVKLILDGIMLIPPEDCPPLICELMRNCWKTEAKHRITFSFIKDVLEEAYYNKKIDIKEFHFSKNKNEEVEEPVSLKYKNELKKQHQQNASIFKTTADPVQVTKKVTDQALKNLPRPPPLPKSISKTDLLDSQGYLLPKEIKEPVQYLRTLPD